MENCKHENEVGNFCSKCGERLRTKCLECGRMELIGRSVCESKLNEAKKALNEFVFSKTLNLAFLQLVLFLAPILSLPLCISKINQRSVLMVLLPFGAFYFGFFLIVYLTWPLEERMRKYYKKSFL